LVKTHSNKDKRPASEGGGSPGISLGEKLRQAREAKGLSLEEVFEKTKLRPSIIESIEGEHWEALPDAVFVRGFLRTYARVLEIDEQGIIGLYEAGLPKENRPFEAILTKKRGTKITWVMAVMIILALFGATYWWIEQPPPGISTKGHGREQINQSFKRYKGGELQSSPPATQGPEHGAATQVKPHPIASNISAPLILKGLVKERTWMRVTTDGGQGKEYIFDPGSRPVWKAQRVFDIIVGNAAGIELELNGKPLGPLGSRGKVVHLVLPKE